MGRGTAHPLGACGASTRLAPSALGLPQTLSLPPILAVSRIDTGPKDVTQRANLTNFGVDDSNHVRDFCTSFKETS